MAAKFRPGQYVHPLTPRHVDTRYGWYCRDLFFKVKEARPSLHNHDEWVVLLEVFSPQRDKAGYWLEYEYALWQPETDFVECDPPLLRG